MLLQHMANCYKAPFANKLSCVSASVAIIHLANEFKSIHALRKNVNMVAMLIRDLLLWHFRKGCTTEGIAVAHSYLLCTLAATYVHLITQYSASCKIP